MISIYTWPAASLDELSSAACCLSSHRLLEYHRDIRNRKTKLKSQIIGDTSSKCCAAPFRPATPPHVPTAPGRLSQTLLHPRSSNHRVILTLLNVYSSVNARLGSSSSCNPRAVSVFVEALPHRASMNGFGRLSGARPTPPITSSSHPLGHIPTHRSNL